MSLSVYTIRKFIKMGMPHYKVGNKFLFDSDEVKPWFAQQFRHENKVNDNSLDHILNEVLADYDR